MENDCRKIIEFCGIPGTGKTSIEVKLEEKYQEKVISEKKIKNSITNRNSKLTLFYLKPKNFIYLLLVLAIYLKNIGHIRENFQFFIKILLMNFYRSQFNNGKIDKNYFFIDEGIIQALVSIWYDKKMKNSYLLRRILRRSYQSDNEIVSYCKIDEKIAKDRIRARNKMQGRLDKIQQDEYLLEILKLQKENFSLIVEILKEKVIEIDTQEEIEKNLQILYKKIGEKDK